MSDKTPMPRPKAAGRIRTLTPTSYGVGLDLR